MTVLLTLYYTPFIFYPKQNEVMEEGVMFRGSVFYEIGMACDSLEERAELWQAIMEYGMYGKEPPTKFKRDFVNIRFILEKNKTLKKKRSEAGKNHTGNQYTKGDTKWKAQNNVVEQMEQAGTNGTNKNKKENKNIKENIKEKFEELVEGLSGEVIDTYKQFLLVRKQNKINNTEQAIKIHINQLKKAENDKIRIEMINRSIANNWRGLFELKPSEKEPLLSKKTSETKYDFEEENKKILENRRPMLPGIAK